MTERWLRDGHRPCMNDAMQEVFSRSIDSKIQLEGQEFYELRIDDSADIWRPGFIVAEAHAQWSESSQQIVWDETEYERCAAYAEVKERYEVRRRALAEKGFIYSGMDPLL